jgi:hypothetical protein
MKTTIFWDVTPVSLVEVYYFDENSASIFMEEV